MISQNILVCIRRADGSRKTDEAVKELARQCLSEDIAEIARSERGKPSFPQRQDLFFSVSHSGGYFVCAFAPCEIGVDMQEIKHLRGETPESASPRLGRMAARFFHPDEAAYVAGDTYFRFFRIWTAKEAYVKLTGQGIDNDFSSLSVLDEGKSLPELQNGEASWHAAGACFTQMQVAQGYSFCVCSREERKIEVLYL